MFPTRTIILDGGTGRELKAIGAPFRQPEWSALALMEGPEFVKAVHTRFINAGADIITTNSYAIVPYHLGAPVFASRAAELAALAGRLAKECSASCLPTKKVLVAGSLPPALGSYRADLFDAAAARPILATLVGSLLLFVDFWLAETLSCIAEAQLVGSVLSSLDGGADKKPLWLSFTLLDSPGVASLPPQLRSGELVTAAVEAAIGLGASAVLFNCCTPESMAPAIAAGVCAAAGRLRIGCYANAFPPSVPEEEANTVVHELRDDVTPSRYVEFAREWVAAGASIIGGCCGIGSEHIEALSALSAACRN